jgi:hypothetical protein
MTNAYVEQDCCFEHEGRSFCAGGAAINGDVAIGYVTGLPEDDRAARLSAFRVSLGVITNWHGDETLGRITRFTSWPIRSYLSPRMYQITARIDGVFYTGRSGGNGMIWRARKVAKQ